MRIPGREGLQTTIPDSNAELKPYYSKTGPQIRTDSINSNWDTVKITGSLSLTLSCKIKPDFEEDSQVIKIYIKVTEVLV